MPENLLCLKQIATTPAYREGWERTFCKERIFTECCFETTPGSKFVIEITDRVTEASNAYHQKEATK